MVAESDVEQIGFNAFQADLHGHTPQWTVPTFARPVNHVELKFVLAGRGISKECSQCADVVVVIDTEAIVLSVLYDTAPAK